MKCLKSLFLFFLINSACLQAQQLTCRDIFDFNVGDVFHYETYSYSTWGNHGGYAIEILDKVITSGNDSIKYYTKKNTYVQQSQGGIVYDTSYSITFDTLIFTTLDTGIDVVSMYNDVLSSYQSLYNYYLANDPGCLNSFNYSDTNYMWTLGNTSTESYFNDFSSNCSSWVTEYQGFGRGLGVVSYSHSVSGGPYYGNSYNMVYFKKDSIEGGTPNSILAVEKIPSINTVTIFPNPTNDLFLIKFNDGSTHRISIYDIQGNWITDVNVQHLTYISSANWNNGIYFLADECGNKIRVEIIH